MKKILFLSAVLLGTAAASHAGVDIHIGLPLPPLPSIIIGHPAPRVIVQPRVVVEPPCAPVVVAPPRCAPSVVVAPAPCAPRVVYVPRRAYYGHRYEHGHHYGRW